MVTVDVVVPCYRYGRYLRDSVGSVLAQEGVEPRVLIIDNASDDDSLDVAEQLAAENSRVDVIAHQTNLGATFSYNEGIDWASADYFLILDADDWLAPGSLAHAAGVMERRKDVSFTHGVEARCLPDGSLCAVRPDPRKPEWTLSTGEEFIERLCRTPVNNIGANTVIRRTAAQKSIGYYRSALPYTDDLEMWLRLATVGSVASSRRVQAVRRVHATRMSVQFDGVGLRDFVEREKAFASFFANGGKSPAEATRLMKLARRGLGQHAYWSAIAHMCRHQRKTGFDLLRFSHQRRPAAALLPPMTWLLRMDRPWDRIAETTSMLFGRQCPGSAYAGEA